MALITTAEAAERLGVHQTRVQVFIREGRLPAQMMAGTYFINEDDLALVADRKPGRPKKSDEAEAVGIPAPPPHPPFPTGRPKKAESKPAKNHTNKAKGRK